MDADTMLGTSDEEDLTTRASIARRRSQRSSQRDDDGIEIRTRKRLEEAGLIVVTATVETKRSQLMFFELEEGLDTFAGCAREMGIKVVFLEPLYLDETDFAFDGPDGEVDLREIESKLRRFERYIDSCDIVRVLAPFSGGCLSFYESAPWFEGWNRLHEEAVARVEASSEEAEERRERQQEEEEQRVRNAIKALASDSAFKEFMKRGRQTFETIIAYMREHVDGAEDLRPGILRDEARALRGRLLLE